MNLYSMHAYNMVTPRGNSVKDQIITKYNHLVNFFSYEKLIATIDFDNKVIYLNQYYWNYSSTTSKYRNEFFKSQGFYEIDTTAALKAQLQVGSVFINDILYTIQYFEQ